jgi:ABC-type multidrug transport system fused ATPase/permease subunit
MPYLFALLSIILLLPFVLYLNLGITKKGKLVIIVLSLLMSVLGILAQMSYPLWQIALIILLLGFFLTYLLNNRFETLLFQNNNENEQNNYIEENFEYRNTIRILEEEEEVPEKETNEKNSIVNENNQDMIDHLIRSLHDQGENDSIAKDFIETSNLDENETSILVEFKDDEEIDQLSQLQYTEDQSDSLVEIPLGEEDLSNTIEEMIKEGEEQSDSQKQKNVDQIVNNDFEDEIEEIEAIIFSSKAVEKTEEIEIIDFDEDEIVPIKEFRPIQKEEDTKFKNEQSVKKENYLSEIEKLIEEE